MKILLTGGAGFIATHTCVELMAGGTMWSLLIIM